jgi:hypothetical protein
MKHKKHRRQKRTSTAPKITPVNAPIEAFVSADRICRLAEAAGWPGREAFRVAMHMVAAGTSPVEAGRAFADAGRWLQ